MSGPPLRRRREGRGDGARAERAPPRRAVSDLRRVGPRGRRQINDRAPVLLLAEHLVPPVCAPRRCLI
eukprot:1577324-Pyramimonas_sp.AAC.1